MERVIAPVLVSVVQCIALTGAEVQHLVAFRHLVHRECRRCRDAAGQDVDLLGLDKLLRLFGCFIRIDFVVAGDELQRSTEDVADLLDGELGAPLLGLGQTRPPKFASISQDSANDM